MEITWAVLCWGRVAGVGARNWSCCSSCFWHFCRMHWLSFPWTLSWPCSHEASLAHPSSWVAQLLGDSTRQGVAPYCLCECRGLPQQRNSVCFYFWKLAGYNSALCRAKLENGTVAEGCVCLFSPGKEDSGRLWLCLPTIPLRAGGVWPPPGSAFPCLPLAWLAWMLVHSWDLTGERPSTAWEASVTWAGIWAALTLGLPLQHPNVEQKGSFQ